MSSLFSKSRQRDTCLLVIVGGLLALELGVLVWLTRFDGNEGWYSLYPSMVLEGQVPYRDFFYHRLPLLPYLFTPAVWMPFSMLASVRILCAVCAWCAWWISALAAEKWTGSSHARLWVLVLGLVSFYGNSYFVTAQSYAPFAMFVALGIWLLSIKKAGGTVRFAFAGLLFGAAMGLRFGPDPMLIVLPAAVFLFWGRGYKDKRLKGLVITFSIFLAGIFVLSASWDARIFMWGVFVWPVKAWEYMQENGFNPSPMTFKRFLLNKALFVLSAIKAYLPVLLTVLVGVGTKLQCGGVRSLWRWFLERSNAELLAWILVPAHLVFFLPANGSGVMQYSFVLPLAAACSVTLARDGLFSMGWSHVSGAASSVFLFSLLATGLSADVPLSCSWFTPGTDVVVLGELGKTLRTYVPPDKYLVTFDPVLAANAHRKVYRGMEFELYGFFPEWDRAVSERFKIYNWPMLKEALTSPLTGAVVLAGRWRDDEGMGRIVRPYRREILDILGRSAELKARLEMPACVAVGSIQIYGNVPKVSQ